MKNTTIKMTEVNALRTALEIPSVRENKELAEKLEQMLNVRVNKGSKVTPKQIENKAISNKVVEHLTEVGKPLTVTEVTEHIKGCQDWKEPVNAQRISRIMTNLKEEGRIVREMERKVAVFFVR